MRTIQFSIVLASTMVLTACGGGSGGGNDVAPPPPISVTISPDAGSLEVGDTLQFSSQVNRDNYNVTWYVNDIQGGNETVGTISSSGLYTAPSSVPDPATVTVKAIPAADTTKSDTAQVAIYPKMSISPTAAVLPSEQTQQFTANKAASWYVDDVAGGNATVGTISASGLYTAPAHVPSPDTVTVKAAWQLNPAKTATASVTVTAASSVSLSPTIATLAAGATQQFNANADVDWQLSGAPENDRPLGTINASGLYTAPSAPPLSGKVTVTATSKADPSQKAIAIVTITFSDASLKGHYVLRLWGALGDNPYFVVGSLVADGAGGVSNAVLDANTLSELVSNTPVTATYSIGPDGRGALNILMGTNDIGWRFVLTSADSGRLIAFGDNDWGWGSIERQDSASFSGGLSGPFAFHYDGVTPDTVLFAAAGMFTANGSGSLINGLQDTSYDGNAASDVMFTGSYSSVNNTTGRGQLSVTDNIGTTHYVYYMLSADSFIFSATDLDRGTIGLALRQGGGPFSKASLSGDAEFDFSGGMPEDAPTQMVGTGRFTADGNGTISEGTQDRNSYGTMADAPFTGTYTINANGQGYASFARTGATDNLRLYMVSPQSAFFVSRDQWFVGSGQIRAQSEMPSANSSYRLRRLDPRRFLSDPPVVISGGRDMPKGAFTNMRIVNPSPAPAPSLLALDASSISGTFGFGLHGTQLGSSGVVTGQLTIDGTAGTISGIADVNYAGTPMENLTVSGTFTMSGNGRGVASLVWGTSSSTMAIYVIDPYTLILIENDPAVPSKFGPALRQY